MFSSKPIKIFVLFFFLTGIFSACNWWKNLSGNSNAGQTPLAAQEVQNNLPFVSVEPENYQAEILLTILSDNEKSTRKTFVAKKNLEHFTTFDAGEKSAVSVLTNAAGLKYLIFPEKKVYTEDSAAGLPKPVENDIRDFISTEWLNELPAVSFEKQRTENNLTVFKTDFGESRNSEILIYFDESLKIPVKQEFYSINGEKKIQTFVAEIQNFVNRADDEYFRVPSDYRKVSREEFDKIILSRK